MAELAELYAQATYYDIVFNREVNHELDFLFGIYSEHNAGKAPQSIIDIACGPGYHALRAAQRGLRSLGLDLREEMVQLGREKAASLGVDVEWLAQDMRIFKLDRPVDVAINAFDSIDVLMTDDDIIAHFQALRTNLTPGGLYLVDVTHPKDACYGVYEPFACTGYRDGIHVKIEWEVHKIFDPVTGLSSVTTHLYATHPDGKTEHFTSPGQERIYTPRELDSLVREAGGFKRIGWWGDYRQNQPLDYSTFSRRAVGIYQRI